MSRFLLFLAISLVLISCKPAPRRDPALGEAFVGPAAVNLRKEIALKSGTVATVHFAEKVEILTIRRRFVRVRTRSGAEGWLDEHMLLRQKDMDQIKAQSDAARALPSQGVATTLEAMNVHAEPNRYSPSYLQLKEGDRFDVLQHRIVAVPPSAIRKVLIPPPPKPAKRPKKENKSKIPPPPAPAPPPLPSDWMDLSKEGEDALPPKIEEPPPTTPEEDWSLIRSASGQSGWVLTRRLYMGIPDEVAQYAEGHRISSYFSLGKVRDEEQDKVKDIWLWTTIGSGNHPYDFDGFRVFIWSLRRHRYETALIQRRLRGYFPTFADASTGTFSLCIAREDGERYRREYRMVDTQVKFVGEKPCDAADQKPGAVPAPAPPNGQKPTDGALEKLKGKLKSIIK